MRALTIANKEVKSFFSSPGFYVIGGISCAVFSWMYPIQLGRFYEGLSQGVASPGMPKEMMNIHATVFMQHLGILNLMLLLIVPAFTMRLLSEEKKIRTFDLLLTSPITSMDIVLGKFIATCALLLGYMLLALSYPLITSTFATVHWPTLATSFTAIFMLGCVYAAIDLFCSSLTESVFISYVVSLIANIFIWFMASGSQIMDSNISRQVFEHISLGNHLGEMVNGTIRTSSLIYIVSLVVLFVFLAERVVESSRWRSA